METYETEINGQILSVHYWIEDYDPGEAYILQPVNIDYVEDEEGNSVELSDDEIRKLEIEIEEQ